MECKRDVLDRNQAVSHSNAGQDAVDGVGLHVLVGEHHDVEEVEDSPHATHYHGHDTVIRKVAILDRLQVTEGWPHASEGGWCVRLGQGAGVAGLAGVELLHVLIVFLGQVLEDLEIKERFSISIGSIIKHNYSIRYITILTSLAIMSDVCILYSIIIVMKVI